MNASVSSAQRFTRRQPCPVCGGHARLEAGQGVRCYGFLSSDERYAHCTREEYAGDLERKQGCDTYAHRLGGLCRCGVTHQEAEPMPLQANGTPPRVYRDYRQAGAVCAYDYRDEHDDMLFQVWRYELPDGRKTFKQARLVPGGWMLGIGGVRRVLYRLFELLSADRSMPILIPEGEKDVDRLGELGFVATTNPMGAGKWLPEYSARLRGRTAILLPDNDADGEKHVEIVGRALSRVGVQVRVLRLPDLPPKGDVSDWLDAGGTPEELERLVAVAPQWDIGDDGNEATLSPDQPSEPRLVVQSLTNVTSQPVDWLWPRWLARGKFHLLGGHAGDGKSTLTAALAAIGSLGGTWPDGSSAPRIRTLFVLGEDSAEDTLRPRLELHDADMDQIFVLKTVLDEEGRERFFNVSKHLDLLEETVIDHEIDLIVIDPLTTIMAGTDRNAEGDTRDTLTPLIKLAERRGVAVIGIAHVGKPNGTARRAAQKILGATAFHALARAVWLVAPDEDEKMVLGVVKSNLAMKPPALVWSRDEDGPIVWSGVSTKGVEELLSGPVAPSARDNAEGFLREFLARGAQPSHAVEQAAKKQGISWSTLRRAAEEIPVKKWKHPSKDGPWYWMLPDGEPQRPEPPAGDDGENLLSPRDIDVSKLSNFPTENVSTTAQSEQLHAPAPISSNGQHPTEKRVSEGAQLAHPLLLSGEQVPCTEAATTPGQSKSGTLSQNDRDLDTFIKEMNVPWA